MKPVPISQAKKVINAYDLSQSWEVKHVFLSDDLVVVVLQNNNPKASEQTLCAPEDDLYEWGYRGFG